ncbi:UPF0561 protein C2orf68 homolog [Lytechinus pictus]|uniref:UPF0561 protein C2orf68 homolog n=1 Tax=Lytechinus pictus TaxID=7653 RepID=UPI00240D6DF8|nr:UPF0561 protein C2orf68 homolog [Lytechinus pictus]
MEDCDLELDDGTSDRGGNVSRLDLTSGFMKHIIRNQQKRDDYDKEVKVMQEQQKTIAKENKSHAKKPGQAIYVPPVKGNKGSGHTDESDKTIFRLQYEDPDREISEWLVHKGDDPHGIAVRFGRQCRLNGLYIKALGSFIEEEMEKRGFLT